MLVGALAHSGRIRAVFGEGESFPELAAALDALLRRLGGAATRWRVDRMASMVYPGSGRLRPEAAELAKHYGVTVEAAPPTGRSARPSSRRRSSTCAAPGGAPQVRTQAEAQASLDRGAVEVSDRRRRGETTVSALAIAEPLLQLPPQLNRATLELEWVVSASALVAFEGNRYSVPPTHAGETVTVSARLGEQKLRIVSAAGVLLATHRRLPTGAAQTVRVAEHEAALERLVLAAFTTKPACRRKANRPPSEEALRLAATLSPAALVEPEIPSLDSYARLAAAR